MRRGPLALLAATLLIVAAGCARPTSGSVAGTVTRSHVNSTDSALQSATLSRYEGAVRSAAAAPGELFVMLREVGEAELWTTGSGEVNVSSSGHELIAAGLTLERAATYPLIPGLSLYRARSPELSGAALGAATESALEALSASPRVAHAFPNWRLEAHAKPNDPYFELQEWHFEQLNLPAAWETHGTQPRRTTVAVLDTGRFDHPDVQWAQGGANFVNWDGEKPQADEGDITNYRTNEGGSSHGTSVAGIIGAKSNNGVGVTGVNWNVSVLPVKVLAANGAGALSGVLEALTWLTGHDSPAYGGHLNRTVPRVVNLSLGGATLEACPGPLNEFFGALGEIGISLVAAAGNTGTPADITFPANCPNVITVGATNLGGALASYSNYGAHIDVMAPGGERTFPNPGNEQLPAMVLSTEGTDSYGFSQGTSMAAPHVAGAISLLLAHEPHLENGELLERLHRASAPLEPALCAPSATGFTGLNLCGAGLLNVEALLSGRELSTTTVTVYAVPHQRGEAPNLTYGHLGSLELLAPHRVNATYSDATGGYEYRLNDLPRGTYTLVAIESRDPATGVSPVDRVGIRAHVEVRGGETTPADLSVRRLRDELPTGEASGSG